MDNFNNGNSEAIGLKVAATALAASSPSHFGEGRQERGPERALRWQSERTLLNLLPSNYPNPLHLDRLLK